MTSTLSENMGAGHARNYSIQKANGRYIAFCDSDDIWMTDKLEKQIAYMQEKKCSFCFSSYFVCDETGTQTSIVLAPHSVSLADTKRDDKIGFLTAVYDTYAYGKFYMPTLRKTPRLGLCPAYSSEMQKSFCPSRTPCILPQVKRSISSNKLSLIKFNAKVYETVFGYSTFLAYFYLFSLFLPSYFLKRVNHKFTNIYYRKTLSAKLPAGLLRRIKCLQYIRQSTNIIAIIGRFAQPTYRTCSLSHKLILGNILQRDR